MLYSLGLTTAHLKSDTTISGILGKGSDCVRNFLNQNVKFAHFFTQFHVQCFNAYARLSTINNYEIDK